ncbi:MAG: redoxin domain-containing protein [Proteobacteria bacterium]|nr:redoxin domain-containing protein [Pseudomonadota bacterium]
MTIRLAIAVLLLASVAFAADLQPGGGAGETAPTFTAVDHAGKEVSLSAALEQGPVLLLFYRGHW